MASEWRLGFQGELSGLRGRRMRLEVVSVDILSTQKSTTDAQSSRASHDPGVDASQKPTESSALPNKSKLTLGVRTVIILLVLISILLVAAITITIGTTTNFQSIESAKSQATEDISSLARQNQRDASTIIVGKIVRCRNWFWNREIRSDGGIDNTGSIKAFVFLQTTAEVIHTGLVQYNDLDQLVPFLRSAVTTVGMGIQSSSIYANVHNAQIPNMDIAAQNRNKRNLTIGTASLGDPAVDGASLDVGVVRQMMVMSIYDPQGTEVAFSIVQFSINNLCQVLDEIKASATLNSVIYIMDSRANIIAMTGLANNSTLRKEILISNGALRSIFSFSSDNFPLVNYTSRVVYEYAGQDLKSNFSDTQWRSGGFMFQVSSTTIWGCKYTIVSGAPKRLVIVSAKTHFSPEEDYLGDTINSSQKLNDSVSQSW
ncbi:hypothetical protein M427DRAFT_49709 [Gonapodya prolifera JEL478]|uniref:Uncharacterized protein n=1 Tax=Gonapodya prolifera (strain JEL478) TaxID=1344416 RepID=A0A138ZXN6_GONPJ|nr:hypothetical protein M427DRAFT_49709 [Gonapodya prolifera JEL478]|eukprot:KXS09257.1 hypothetical protein M427DRAFT_49709 [Gonapodya prolifera JEL478]